MKINNFRGDLADNSAKKEALLLGCAKQLYAVTTFPSAALCNANPWF